VSVPLSKITMAVHHFLQRHQSALASQSPRREVSAWLTSEQQTTIGSALLLDNGQTAPYSRQCGLLQPCPRLS
jgi:hypothetical protein